MDRVYLNDLFDLYQELLSDREVLVFKDYYQNDLSLKEISDNEGVTRNAIHKTIKSVEKKLDSFEDKLRLYHKREKILNAIDKNDLEEIKNILYM